MKLLLQVKVKKIICGLAWQKEYLPVPWRWKAGEITAYASDHVTLPYRSFLMEGMRTLDSSGTVHMIFLDLHKMFSK